MGYKAMVMGFYGYDNTGDEVILHGMVDTLRRVVPDLELTICSANPVQTARRFALRSVFAGRRLAGMLPLFRELRRSDLFILGGGGLLQDRERRIIPYWLSRVVLAKLAGARVMFYAQGVGPIRTPLGKRLVRQVANRVDLITVRDEESAALLRSLGVNRPPIIVTADPALALDWPDRSVGQSVLTAAGIPASDRPLVGISLRQWPGMAEIAAALAGAVDYLTAELGCRVVFIPMQGAEDQAAADSVIRLVDRPAEVYTLRGDLEPRETAAVLGCLDLVVAMRLHALILAVAQGVPGLGVAYDPKVANFARRVGLGPYVCALDGLSGAELREKMGALWGERQAVAAAMGPAVAGLRRAAAENGRLARELLD